jgi:hypothetical protein
MNKDERARAFLLFLSSIKTESLFCLSKKELAASSGAGRDFLFPARLKPTTASHWPLSF